MKRFRALACFSTRALLVCAFSSVGIIIALMPAGAETRIQKTFGTWVVTCVENDGQKGCSLITRAITKTDKTAFIWSIRLVDKQVLASLLVPTDTSIPEGVRLSIGDATPQTTTYSVCGPRFCRADFPVDAALLKRISSAQKATANFVTGDKKLVQVELNLAQFQEAYGYLAQQSSK
jgi:invasion protein IalB